MLGINRLMSGELKLIGKTKNKRLLIFSAYKKQSPNNSDFLVFTFGSSNQERFLIIEMRNRRIKTPTTTSKSDREVLEHANRFLMS